MDILLVTAHPDDECMFFTPSVRHFIGRGDRVDLICLSTGNFDGIGRVRRNELEKSARILGIDSVKIIEDEELMDGPKNDWKSEIILKYIDEMFSKKDYKYILTFDDYGVSGHENHRSISRAFNNSKYSCLKLQSLPILLKYSGLLGALICKVFNKYFPVKGTLPINICFIEAYYCGHRAMLQHESQLVWFRKLYLIFSIYMTFNLLKFTNKQEND